MTVRTRFSFRFLSEPGGGCCPSSCTKSGAFARRTGHRREDACRGEWRRDSALLRCSLATWSSPRPWAPVPECGQARGCSAERSKESPEGARHATHLSCHDWSSEGTKLQ